MSTGTNGPTQASFPIPPPSIRVPFGTVKDGKVWLDQTSLNFLQQIWAAIQGSGGVIDISAILSPSAGATVALAEDVAEEAALSIGLRLGHAPETPELSDTILWTPTLAGSTTAGAQTYAKQVGRLAYIGPVVVCSYSIELTALDAATAGNVLIEGLPVPAQASADKAAGWISSYANLTLTAGAQLGAEIDAGQAAINLVESVSASALTPLPAAGLSATTTIAGGVAFFR